MQRSKLRVACLQTGSVREEDPTGQGIERAKLLLDEARHAGAEIAVFPELFLAPFFPKRLRADIDQFFLDLDDGRLGELREHCRARKLAAIVPIAEKRNGSHYNSAVFVEETGEIGGVYRKTISPAYLPNDQPGGTGSYEKFYFTPGETLSGLSVARHHLRDPDLQRSPVSGSLTYPGDEGRRGHFHANQLFEL